MKILLKILYYPVAFLLTEILDDIGSISDWRSIVRHFPGMCKACGRKYTTRRNCQATRFGEHVGGPIPMGCVVTFLIIAAAIAIFVLVHGALNKVKGFFSSEPAKTTTETAPANAATVMSMDYSIALQTSFPNGSLGENKRPIEVHFQSVSKNGDSYTINGYTKTKAAQDVFSGTLNVSSEVKGGSCGAGEIELRGSYNLNEKESKTSGRFAGNFVACENSGSLSSANFSGKWIKHSNNNETPCSWSK